MVHSIGFDAEDDLPAADRPVSTFALLPPPDAGIDPGELGVLRARLEERGLVEEVPAGAGADETVTVRELFETPVEFDGERRSLRGMLSDPIPPADGASLEPADLYWLVGPDPWDPEPGEARRLPLAELLDAPWRGSGG